MPPPPTYVIRNLQAADTFSGVIDRKLKKEIALGRIVGPYVVVPFSPITGYLVWALCLRKSWVNLE